jgi:hypothetical protein
MDLAINDLLTCAGSILASSIAFSKIFLNRMEKLEDRLTISIEKMTDQITDLKSGLAANTTIINHYLGDLNGDHRNKKTY